MKTPVKDYQQQKATGGNQKIILNEEETAETDELDARFDTGQQAAETGNNQKFEPGDDAKIELI
jgi:hypothetical protein